MLPCRKYPAPRFMLATAASLSDAGSPTEPPVVTQPVNAAAARPMHAERNVLMDSSSDHSITQTHPLPVAYAARELTARGRDVVAARPTNRRDQARVPQRLPKRVDRRLRRAAELGLWEGIERNQV